MKQRRLGCLIGTVLLVCVGIATASMLWAFLFVQPVQVRRSAEGVVVDLQILGEYMANVTRIRISEPTGGAVAVDLRAADRFVPVWTISLRRGANEADLGLRDPVRVIVPQGAKQFVLQAGREYRFEVWAVVNGLSSHRTTTFML
jgi:hypothetical protein